MRISYWSSDVCSSDLSAAPGGPVDQQEAVGREPPGDRQRQDPSDTANIGSEQRREQVEAGIVGDLHVQMADRHHPEAPGKILHAETEGAALELAGDHEGEIHGDEKERQLEYAEHGETARSEEHTSKLQSIMRISYADF